MPADGMGNPHDVIIDIPLNDAPSRGGNLSSSDARKWSSHNQTPDETIVSEKAGLVTTRGPGRRRRRREDTSASDNTITEAMGKPAESPEDGTLNRMGRIYQAILNFSIVTRYLIYVTPIAVLIAIPIIVGATAAKEARIGGVHIYWFFAWIEVVWLSLWVAKIFAHFLPYVFQFLCGIVSSGTRKYALILRALETPISLVLWSVISLVTFLPIMTLTPGKKENNDTDVKSWEKSIKNILFALLVCSLILLGEKAIVQLISISYHRKQFDTKIKESKRNVYLVGLLFEASRNMFPAYCPEFRDEDAIIFDSLLAQGGQKGGKRGSTMPLRMMRQVGHNVGRIGDKVTAAFGNVASELTGKQVFNPNATHSVVVQALERKRCSEALARRIWMSFVVEGREALYLEDIVEVLGPDHEAEAEECFASLDKDGNGDISLDETILAITEFGRMRKSLNHSMHDVDQAIHVLDNLLLGVAFIIAVLVFISFVTSGFGTVIAAGATTFLSLSFVFATTAQEVLGSCIFLFSKHPFDIGDRVDISDKSYIVERISLLFTVFRSVTDHRITQVPNNILNSLWIDNFTRANAMHEQLTVPVSFDTTFADIQMLREEMERFVRDKDNCRDFQENIDIEVVGVGDMDKLELRVDIRHKSNWSNETVRASRRSKFMCALVLAVRKIPMRAPGVAAEEETKSDDDDGDDNGDNADTKFTGNRKSTQGRGADQPSSRNDDSGQMGLTAAAAAATGGMMKIDSTTPNSAQSTGFDHGRSGSVYQRGSGAAAQSQREAAYAEQLNSRAPTVDATRDEREQGLYRTATNSTQGQQPNAQGGGAGDNTNAPSRGLSTGRRKEGTRTSYNEHGVPSLPAPSPLSPVHSGLTPSTSDVPILGAPTPPSRGSARYEPRPLSQPQSQAQAPQLPYNNNNSNNQGIVSPNPAAYNTYSPANAYDPVHVTGVSAEHTPMRNHRFDSGPPISGITASSNYDFHDRYDPVSPSSLHSPPPPPAPAPAATAPAPGPTSPPQSEAVNRRSSFLAKALRRDLSRKPYAEH
ncbi:hypothetical protein NUU61_002873 [Penicillium alfredii]|uniref:EF-hand domain-containing protein n=1 Tax=Penicillium alfredii TaxID=1506179 RepID=A0A9W9KH02_9EURO|nr:uncharacterized protein NUU61_002873 [Penicillium alfredii]KAJ5105526.1 hypothetical protein NUU61_002873 [Penicillium alfredii]